MPVLFDFDHSRPFGTATFDTSTGDFLMRIHRRTKLWRMLAGADERGVVVAVAIRPFDPATDEVDEGNKDE
jgi:hypothetical protein